MEYPIFAAILIGSYLLGSINLAQYLARRRAGVDLREVGSGNVGTVNLYHEVGKGVGTANFFFDCAKEAAVILALRAGGFGLWVQAAAGLAVIAGHNWPIFFHFEGGRGMAMTLIGTLIMLPREGIVMVGLLAIGVQTRHTPEMNLMAVVLTPILAWRLGRSSALIFYAVGLLIFCVLRRLQGSPGVGEKSLREGGWEVFWKRLIYDREPA
jgi:glycerol-3-phosphate acyltransferase PlsY